MEHASNEPIYSVRDLPGSGLQLGKVYRLLPDEEAADVGCLRVIDDSGEDYLYAATRFVVVEGEGPRRDGVVGLRRFCGSRPGRGAKSKNFRGFFFRCGLSMWRRGVVPKRFG